MENIREKRERWSGNGHEKERELSPTSGGTEGLGEKTAITEKITVV